MLDKFREHKLFLSAMIGQWVGVFLCLSRRSLSPTKFDLLFIRYGLLPLVVVAHYLAPLVWKQIRDSSISGFQRLFGIPSPEDLLDTLGMLGVFGWLIWVLLRAIFSGLSQTSAIADNGP